MKRIGLTPKITKHSKRDEIQESVDINWARLILQIGAFPVFLFSIFSTDDIKNLKLDGVILTGGNDLSVVNQNPLSVIRDNFETMVFDFCLKEKIKILGICRGMQFLGYQTGNTPVRLKGHVTKNQEIVIRNGCSFYSVLSQIKKIDSYHDYGFYKVDDSWEVLARSRDNVIKAMRHKQGDLLAHMWHPERENSFNCYHTQLIINFFEGNNN